MEVFINNERKSLTSLGLEKSDISVLQLSLKLSNHPSRLAILVNGVFVPRERWGNVLLKENDKVEVVSLIAGG